MTLYIYDFETLEIVDKIEGETNEMCEKIAAENWNSADYGWTYTPAFGVNCGLDVRQGKIFFLFPQAPTKRKTLSDVLQALFYAGCRAKPRRKPQGCNGSHNGIFGRCIYHETCSFTAIPHSGQPLWLLSTLKLWITFADIHSFFAHKIYFRHVALILRGFAGYFK